jgi:N-carbamoyl-L-amino-acid hydrolase
VSAGAITGEAIARRLAGLDDIGLRPTGYSRLAWTAEDGAAAAWFAGQAAGLGLSVERDGAGNLWACPPSPGPWWAIGSHLDTVRDGGRYDGALGVAAAFEVAAQARGGVAVISFADEEGARFNTPTFGSRALTGRLDVPDALARRDDDGVSLAEAMAAAGVDPAGLAGAPGALERLRGFLEIHIDQTTDLADAGVPAGPVRALAARLRLAVEVEGAADHAGTTRRGERRDALAAAARMMVAAEDLAEPHDGFVVTTARLLVTPNALTTVPSRVRMWVDARAPEPATVTDWETAFAARVSEIAGARREDATIARASFNEGTRFDEGVLGAMRAAAGRLGAPTAEVTCFAGHDAGVLAARRPSGMLLVRNRAGVSHSPAEHVELEDAAVAARIALETLEDLR